MSGRETAAVDHEEDAFLPDEIRGDLDSLQDHVKEYYSSRVCDCAFRTALIGFLVDAASHLGSPCRSRPGSIQYRPGQMCHGTRGR